MSILTDPVWQVMLGIALTVAITLRAWIRHRTAVVRDRGKTRRLETAIDGTDPQLRPDIVRACNELETPPPLADLPPDEQTGQTTA